MLEGISQEKPSSFTLIRILDMTQQQKRILLEAYETD
jgi:protein-arginine kinase